MLFFYKIPFYAACILILAGCGSDEVYDAYKCGKAADMLGDSSKLERSLLKVENKLRNYSSIDALGLESKFTDDLELYRYSPEAQVRILNSVYTSDLCREYYK